MDPATLIGIVLAFGALVTMVFLEGASLDSILLPAPMILVFGATIAVGIASGTIPDAVQALKALPRAFRGGVTPPQEVIDQVVGYAERARREGLLSLEQEADEVDDPFVKTALQNIADGTDAEDLRTLLDDEIATRERVNRSAAKFYTTLGGYAPTIGIIGTVVSLTHVLEDLSSPEKLGHSIAAAFVATLWGVLSANFIWLPIGTRLARLAELDAERMTLLMEGMVAVQAGHQPRMLAERLRALVPAHQLPSTTKAAAKESVPIEQVLG
ncbi:chemotaxis protein MotA [Diaminobutyricimonas aerilata]|uniref:Chemotaxis protein MotA n=1 Tax=Diaminobutyricimonas aerilata TaxID=1162967 RepID=A0A2M9CN04_9MICO|nr:MotA/TolQ/ExbB proton channel family protein [Diaminobutyricimonas aerilata]PJJ73280.1 chemotaxis protein MotA [Diaminobutyricimonas aerilata]